MDRQKKTNRREGENRRDQADISPCDPVVGSGDDYNRTSHNGNVRHKEEQHAWHPSIYSISR